MCVRQSLATQHVRLAFYAKSNPVSQAEYDVQGTDSVGEASGRVVLLPTVVMNGKQYRGRLDVVSVTKALCAGFAETTEPEVRHAKLFQIEQLLHAYFATIVECTQSATGRCTLYLHPAILDVLSAFSILAKMCTS